MARKMLDWLNDKTAEKVAESFRQSYKQVEVYREMSLFEDISVIPVFQGIVRIHDSEKDHCWDEQVYLGLSFSKAQSAITASTTSDWPKTGNRCWIPSDSIRLGRTVTFVLNGEMRMNDNKTAYTNKGYPIHSIGPVVCHIGVCP